MVPSFQPIRAGSGRRLERCWPRTTVRRKRRAMAAGLAMAAAALAAYTPRADSRPPRGEPRAPAAAAAQDVRDARDMVRAPVRIADAGAVRLLRPGDRVDVLAAARVVAVAAPVVAVPPDAPDPPDGSGAVGRPGEGALIVLAVPRRTAAVLTGAAASTPLAVTLC